MENRIIKPITIDGQDRLITAILEQTLQDWKKYSKQLWSKPLRVIAIYELKQIINFIMSDWYVYLTNGNSPQETIVKGLINKIEDEICKKELWEYAKEKSRKPFIFDQIGICHQLRK